MLEKHEERYLEASNDSGSHRSSDSSLRHAEDKQNRGPRESRAPACCRESARSVKPMVLAPLRGLRGQARACEYEDARNGILEFTGQMAEKHLVPSSVLKTWVLSTGEMGVRK